MDNSLASNPVALNKYRVAAQICNEVLGQICKRARVAGTPISTLCEFGDQLIVELTSKVFTKSKGIEKGVAFPTTVSCNSIISGYAPTHVALVLQDNDLAKIELGVQIDGYIATAAHTVLVGNFDKPVTGTIADAVCASYLASQLLERFIKIGVTSTECARLMATVAKSFRVKLAAGHSIVEMRRFIVAHPQKILELDNEGNEVSEPFYISKDECYSVNVVMIGGADDKETNVVESREDQPTIYRRNIDRVYSLKLKSSRDAFSLLMGNHSIFPFHVRVLNESRLKLGFQECMNQELYLSIPVLRCGSQNIASQFKNTLLVQENIGTLRLTEPSDAEVPFVHSEWSLPQELVNLLQAKSNLSMARPLDAVTGVDNHGMEIDK